MNRTQTHWEEPVDLNTRLAEIREMQGKEPLSNPGVIQGFQQGSPPPPDWLDPEDEAEDEHEGPPSPMVPRDVAVRKAPQGPQVAPGGTFAPIPGLDLIVVENEAAYKGHAVTLNQQERSSIARVILGASQRILNERLAEVEAPPRVVLRTAREELAAAAPKKRGRPKKS